MGITVLHNIHLGNKKSPLQMYVSAVVIACLYEVSMKILHVCKTQSA